MKITLLNFLLQIPVSSPCSIIFSSFIMPLQSCSIFPNEVQEVNDDINIYYSKYFSFPTPSSRGQWHPTPVLLPRKSHGQRSLVGCSHGVAKSRTWLSDFTFTFHFHALEKEMATHSSVLAWRIPGTGEPGGLPSMGLHRVGHDWSDLAASRGQEERWYEQEGPSFHLWAS